MVINRAQQEIIWIAPKKFQKLLRRLAPLTFLIRFGTHFSKSFRISKSSWMMDPTRSREMPSCSAIDLAEIWRSSKISWWIWSIISGVATVLGGPDVNFLRQLALQEKKPDDSSRLDVVEIMRVAWPASFQPLYQERTCNSAHEQPLFPTTLSIPSYDIGK